MRKRSNRWFAVCAALNANLPRPARRHCLRAAGEAFTSTTGSWPCRGFGITELLALLVSCPQVAAALVGSVNSLDVAANGELWVGGRFQTDDGVYTNLVRVNRQSGPPPTVDDPFGLDRTLQPLEIVPATAAVNAVRELFDGDILVAFSARSVQGISQKLWRFSPDGRPRIDFVSSIGLTDNAFNLQVDAGGQALVVGNFSSTYEPARVGLRLFEDGRIDSELQGSPQWLAPDGRFWRITPSGSRRFYTADADSDNERTNLTVTVTIPPTRLFFRPDGRVITLGGALIDTNGVRYNNFAQLSAQGAIDPMFAANGNISGAQTVALQPDGKLLVGGGLLTAFGKVYNRVLRLDASGALDDTFQSTPGADGNVAAIAITPDGVAWFGGSFTNFNGSSSRGLARVPLVYSAAPEQVGFRWTRVDVAENATAVRLELIRQGAGASEVRGLVRLEGAGLTGAVSFAFAAQDFKPKVILFPLAIDNHEPDGDRNAVATIEDLTGAAPIENAGACAVQVRDDESGLTAEYYELAPGATVPFNIRTANMFGRLVKSTRDARIRLNWDMAPPVPGLTTNVAAAVWRGEFVPAQSGGHHFRGLSDDGLRLWVNGELILDDWALHPASELKEAKGITLEAGQAVPIEVHYVNQLLSGSVEVSLQEYPLRRRHFRPASPEQGTPVSVLWGAPIRYVGLGFGTTLTADLMGTPPILVQWFANGEIIPGATNFSLALRNMSHEMTGEYGFIASNRWGVATNSAILVAGNRAALVNGLLSQVSQVGENVELRQTATGDEPVGFVWKRDGTILSQSEGTLRLPGVTTNDAGLYVVNATNRFGASASASFRLYVLDHASEPARLEPAAGPETALTVRADSALRYLLQSSVDLAGWVTRTNGVANGATLPTAVWVSTNNAEFFRLLLGP